MRLFSRILSPVKRKKTLAVLQAEEQLFQAQRAAKNIQPTWISSHFGYLRVVTEEEREKRRARIARMRF